MVGVRTTPEPPYEVIRTQGEIELRQYETQLIAETLVPVSGDDRSPGNGAFRRLANYIFGENTRKAEIEMTAPVLQAPQNEKIDMTAPVIQARKGDQWWMAFVLPKGYTLENAPIPNDDRVQLRTLPPMRLATIRYSGRNSVEKMARHEARLRAWLSAERVEAVGPARMAGYDPPWTVPFLRRNEIQIPIE